ncbi:glycosyltransferase family 9 protein [Candidatus Babeliales bacterium]|nr:glycosyltransferase family 9 protein [Candidatus Babeliales bacterium]
MKILILRVSAIGDVIHTFPAIFLLKKLYPKAEISWVIQKKAAILIENQSFIKNTWILPDKFLNIKNWKTTFKILKKIRQTKWDAILDFQGILKTSTLLIPLHGAKYGFDKKHARSKFTTLLTNNHVSPLYTNIIQKNLALADNIKLRSAAIEQGFLNSDYIKSSPTIDILKKDFLLNIPKENQNLLNEWLKKNNLNNFIAITPNTTWKSKFWPLQNWKKLLTLLTKSNYQVVLLGEAFGNDALKLSEYSKENNLNLYAAPENNLLDTAYLISKSKLLIAPDTGILHLADFLGTSTIGLFGPTLKEKHGPFLISKNIKNCIQIPCVHFYKKYHGNKNSFDCMNRLTPTELINHIEKTLNN